MNTSALAALVRWIAIITVATGGVQLVAAGPILRVLGTEESPASIHFFAIIGMFMVVVGGVLHAALASAETPRAVIGWAAAQKFGASAAVALGVARHVFSSIALAVAAFDLASAVLVVAFLRRSSARANSPVLAE